MSALGDYIHLSTDNYLIYGTAHKGDKAQLFSDALQAQRDKTRELVDKLHSISDSALAELKNRVSNENQQKTARELAEQEVSFVNDIDKLSDDMRKFLINNVNKNIGKVSLLRQIQSDNKKVNIDEARRIRRNLYNNINKLNMDMQNGKVQNSESRINKIIENFDAFFVNLGLSAKDGSGISSLFKIKANASTLSALDSFIKSISLQEANKATLNGVFGEILVNSIDDTAQHLAGKELEKAMREALKTGAETSSFKIDESMVSQSVAERYEQDTGLNIYQVNSSQNKVDASITIKGEDVEASVKAYTPKGNIITPHLQDINLLTSLATTEEQFANHWLNIHAADRSLDIQSDADDALVEHMEYEALAAGNLLKKDSSIADTFVIIDVVQGRVYAKRIKDILTTENANFLIRPNISSIRIKNLRADSWKARISNILQQIHEIKISVLYKVQLEKK